MAGVAELAPVVGVKRACAALGLPRASFYRRTRADGAAGRPPVRTAVQPRALSGAEREAVLSRLREERFQDVSPAAVYATLLDEGEYHCSIRTMYRILEEEGETRERRDQLVHPPYRKEELLATRPNELWSWDITKLKGPVTWTYFYLYVIIDVFSRYVVGWMVADGESAVLAKQFIAETCARQGIEKGRLTIHADRGSSMTSKPVAFLMADLGVTKTHSRPHVSDDNPYSESHFKTMKYRPDFPERFGSIEDARSFSRRFVDWYNNEHRHSGLGLLSPSVVHHGLAVQTVERRAGVLDAAYLAHPERFVHRPPQPPPVSKEAWINKPKTPDNNTQ